MYNYVCGAGPYISATEKYLWDYNFNNYGAIGIFFNSILKFKLKRRSDCEVK